jgi:hypothetical protein
MGLASVTWANTIQDCTHNAFLWVYIATFGSTGCLDQNLMFSNFQYTPTSAAALPADAIFAEEAGLAPPETLARCFTKARATDVREVLDTLVYLGQARETAGRYVV